MSTVEVVGRRVGNGVEVKEGVGTGLHGVEDGEKGDGVGGCLTGFGDHC